MQETNQKTHYVALASLALAFVAMLFRGKSIVEFDYTWNNIAAIFFLLVAFVCIAIPTFQPYFRRKRGKATTASPQLNDYKGYAINKGVDDQLLELLKEHSANLSTLLNIVADRQRGGGDAQTVKETAKEGNKIDKTKGKKEGGETRDKQRPVSQVG